MRSKRRSPLTERMRASPSTSGNSTSPEVVSSLDAAVAAAGVDVRGHGLREHVGARRARDLRRLPGRPAEQEARACSSRRARGSPRGLRGRRRDREARRSRPRPRPGRRRRSGAPRARPSSPRPRGLEPDLAGRVADAGASVGLVSGSVPRRHLTPGPRRRSAPASRAARGRRGRRRARRRLSMSCFRSAGTRTCTSSVGRRRRRAAARLVHGVVPERRWDEGRHGNSFQLFAKPVRRFRERRAGCVTARASVRTIHVFTETPPAAAAASTWSFSASARRSVMRALAPSSAGCGSASRGTSST